MTRVELEPAWLLHRRPWRESSLLAEAFTRDHGRIALVARGARAARSGRHGQLEPFRKLLLSWSQRGEMATLTGIETAAQAAPLTGEALWCGFYCNELLMHLLPRQDPAPALWTVYSEMLLLLPDSERRAGGLRCFELAVLDELGVVPDLAVEAASGAPIEAQQRYRIDPDAGPVAQAGAAGTVGGDVLLALVARQFADHEMMHAARSVTRVLLDRHLEGRSLKARDLFG